MSALFTPFKVGLLVIGSVFAFAWMFGQIKGGIDDDAAGYHVSAVLSDVGGLAPKSRVVIAGINVGQIDRIELEGDQARVWLLVNTQLKSDAHIAKRSAGLLGEFFLQLTPGAIGTPLKEGDEIVHVDYDTAPGDVINEVKEITANINEITAAMNRIVTGDGGEAKIRDMLEQMNLSVGEVRRTIAANGPKVDLMMDSVLRATQQAEHLTREFRRDAKTVLADAKRISGDARDVTSNVKALIGRDAEGNFDGIKGAVSRLQGALAKLDGTLDHTQSIASKIDDGQGTIGRLINDDSLITSVDSLVDESSRFVKRITRLQVVVAMRADWYVNAGSSKTMLELRLKPRPDKFYSLGLTSGPRGKSSFVRRVTTSSASDQDPVVSEQTYETNDQFRLSLQFAKRIGFVQARVGMIESTGGAGIDLIFFDDALEIGTDIFDLDAATNPRLRTTAMYRFFTHLYIAGGVDDVLNPDLTDWFMGAGVRFTDNDLVAILATAPIPVP